MYIISIGKSYILNMNKSFIFTLINAYKCMYCAYNLDDNCIFVLSSKCK